MDGNSGRVAIAGARKAVLYCRIALGVAWHFGRGAASGEIGPVAYLQLLRRSLLFLMAIRHSKAVRRGGLTKIHIYIPAYPSRAFFHLLEKFVAAEPGASNVVFSIGKACRYKCPHCYQRLDAGKDLEVGRMVQVAREMQDSGTSLFDIEGGEPLLQIDRAKALLLGLDDRSEQWLNTTGDRLTRETVEDLKGFGLTGVFVSLHSPIPQVHDAFTGVPGSHEAACRALELFGSAGIFTAINCVPSPDGVMRGEVEAILEIARVLRCDFIQIIHPKPSGAWLERAGEKSDDGAVIAKLREIHLKYNGGGDFLGFPSVSAQVFEEEESRFGCTAGGVDRYYMGADGEVQPCEFLNISFGNVGTEEFGIIFKRMRSFFQRPCANWLCCTQAESIQRAVTEHGLTRTPVPWEITRDLVAGWDRGKETPLYRSLGIYKRRGDR